MENSPCNLSETIQQALKDLQGMNEGGREHYQAFRTILEFYAGDVINTFFATKALVKLLEDFPPTDVSLKF